MENYVLTQSDWDKKGGVSGLFKGSQDFSYAFWLFFCLPYLVLIIVSLAIAEYSGTNAIINNLSIFVPLIVLVSILSLFVLIKNIKNSQSKLLAYSGMLIATFVIFDRAIAVLTLLILSFK
ncbi:MAG: hypothetical protein HRU38_10745 [Saccharospirillaceae bacterium]|nr:hypothetical protein [Saccharospirillaceae bacterium]